MLNLENEYHNAPKNYNRQLTKLELETHFPTIFKDLKLDEKPPLTGIDIGIFTRSAIDETIQEIDGLSFDLRTRQAKDIPDVLRAITDNGHRIYYWRLCDDSHLFFRNIIMNSIDDSFDNSIKGFDKLLIKLNQQDYKKFKNNYAVMRDVIFAQDTTLQSTLSILLATQKRYPITFTSLFVIVPSHIYYFDLVSGTYSTVPYDTNIQYKLATQAWSQTPHQEVCEYSMPEELQQYADELVTKCNNIITELGFDTSLFGTGYTSEGTLCTYHLKDDGSYDVAEDLQPFFNFVENKSYLKVDILTTIETDYQSFNKMRDLKTDTSAIELHSKQNDITLQLSELDLQCIKDALSLSYNNLKTQEMDSFKQESLSYVIALIDSELRGFQQ